MTHPYIEAEKEQTHRKLRCCENCVHLEYVNHVDACCFLLQGTVFKDKDLLQNWNTEKDYCSRFELRCEVRE